MEYSVSVAMMSTAVEMAINGGGIRDTRRVLGISKSTVISTLKAKADSLV